MMKKMIVFITVSASCLLLSCEGIGPCAGKDDFWEDSFTFDLYSKTNDQNLLGIYGKYHLDSVEIYDKQGKVIFDETVELSGRMYFPYLNRQTDLAALSAPLVKTYYLHLGPSPYDVDTIAILIKLRRDKCDQERFEYAQIFYNDSLYYEGNGGLYNENLPHMRFYK